MFRHSRSPPPMRFLVVVPSNKNMQRILGQHNSNAIRATTTIAAETYNNLALCSSGRNMHVAQSLSSTYAVPVSNTIQ